MQPIDSEKFREFHQSAYLEILRTTYPDRYAELERVNEPIAQIVAKGGNAGLALWIAINPGFLQRRPWLSKKMGITPNRVSSIRATLLKWSELLSLPTDTCVWAQLALGERHVEPDLRPKMDMSDLSPKDFIFNRWQPGRQTRTEYLKDIKQWMNWYLDQVEAFFGDNTQVIWRKDSELNTRNLEWVAWYLVEKLSLREISNKMSDPRNFRESVDRTTVSKALSETMILLDLRC
jgi:hypothetical protein